MMRFLTLVETHFTYDNNLIALLIEYYPEEYRTQDNI